MALRGTGSSKVAWYVALAPVTTYVLVLITAYGLANFQPDLVFSHLWAFHRVIAAASILASIVSRRFLGAVLLNVVLLLWIGLLSMLLTALSTLSMNPATDPSRHANRVIETSELIGTWKVTEQTLHTLFFKERYYLTSEPHLLTLEADRKLTFKSFVDGFRTPEREYDYLETNGEWTLTPYDPSQKRSFNRLHLELAGPKGQIEQSFSIMESSDGELVLWQVLARIIHGSIGS